MILPKKRSSTRVFRQDERIHVIPGPRPMSTDNEIFFTELNETAYYVWSRCDGKTSVSELASEILDEFDDAERDVVESDILVTLDELKYGGLLEEGADRTQERTPFTLEEMKESSYRSFYDYAWDHYVPLTATIELSELCNLKCVILLFSLSRRFNLS